MNYDKKGNLFVISGPSGVGKGTLVNLLTSKCPDIKLSVSSTTRNPRAGEVNGVHYFFTDKDRFKKGVENGEFLEWAEFAGNYYGTSKKVVDESINNGNNLILEIDVQGALQVKEKISDAVLVFIEPPSLEELKSRLCGRKTESEEDIQKRLAVVESEFKKKDNFNYCIVNDDLNKAFDRLLEVMDKESAKQCH